MQRITVKATGLTWNVPPDIAAEQVDSGKAEYTDLPPEPKDCQCIPGAGWHEAHD